MRYSLMKKILSLLSIVIALCLVAGCGNGAKKPGGNTDTSSSTTASGNSDSTSSQNTTSRLNEVQMKMSQYLGDWSSKISDINSAAEGKFTFLVSTDTHHYKLDAVYMGKNVAALSNFVDLKFTANLGDLIRGYSVQDVDGPENMRACMDDLVSRYTTNSRCPVFMTVGNHDTNHMWFTKWADHTAQMTPEEQVKRVFEPLKKHNGDKMITDDDGSYYYMDFDEDKIRVVVLNTSNGTYDGTGLSDVITISQKQVDWFKTKALNTDYAIIVMSHVPLTIDFPEHSDMVENSNLIVDAVDSYVENGGNFIAYMYGHVHGQSVLVEESGRLHISFKEFGTQNSEVVMIDTKTRTINTIGLGYAESREFRY